MDFKVGNMVVGQPKVEKKTKKSQKSVVDKAPAAPAKETFISKEWVQPSSPDFDFGILEFTFVEQDATAMSQDSGSDAKDADSGENSVTNPQPEKATKAAHVLRKEKRRREQEILAAEKAAAALIPRRRRINVASAFFVDIH